jgi:hypothetical protein
VRLQHYQKQQQQQQQQQQQCCTYKLAQYMGAGGIGIFKGVRLHCDDDGTQWQWKEHHSQHGQQQQQQQQYWMLQYKQQQQQQQQHCLKRLAHSHVASGLPSIHTTRCAQMPVPIADADAVIAAAAAAPGCAWLRLMAG